MLLFEVEAFVGKRSLHVGGAEADMLMYVPGGQAIFVAVMQVSVSRLLLDILSLKKPEAHASHVGLLVVLPMIAVYLPAGHKVWARHT